MALMPDRHEDQLKLLGVLVLAGLVAMYWLYMYRPRSEELVIREERLSQLEFQNRRFGIRVGNLEEVRGELERYRAALDRLRGLVPTRSEIPVLYDAVARTSRTADVELVSVVPQQTATDSSSHYRVQRWSMRVEGGYHAVGRFLAGVAALDRLVRPEVMTVTPVESGGPGAVRVGADLELEAYVLPDGGSAAGDRERRMASRGES